MKRAKRAITAITLLIVASATVGCQSKMGRGCAGGQCGLLGGSCADGSCSAGGGGGADANYVANQGQGGPLGGVVGRHHRGPQSHLGQTPGPAQGDAAPTYGYPYYTTRGPRDFLNPNPPSIGR